MNLKIAYFNCSLMFYVLFKVRPHTSLFPKHFDICFINSFILCSKSGNSNYLSYTDKESAQKSFWPSAKVTQLISAELKLQHRFL